MSREKLFKAKRLDNGKWIEGYLFCIWEQAYICWGTVNGVPDMKEVDPETVCQCTGKIDVKRRGIWEEDFVKINGEWIGRIVWNDDTTSFCIFPNNDIAHDTFCLGYYTEEGYRVEVIGNIFDNPELAAGSDYEKFE